ncbi:hemagglutinin repeat-containing protein [Chromobacterium violaceum]|uniref:hemagglutinin repeat-containing protein n=1 Tax=Chromobacterium violaceum TaxID=536 RepID=UPI0039F72689
MSGGNVTLQGIAKGQQVVGDIAGNLKIDSLQDTSTYHSRQRQAGQQLQRQSGARPVRRGQCLESAGQHFHLQQDGSGQGGEGSVEERRRQRSVEGQR